MLWPFVVQPSSQPFTHFIPKLYAARVQIRVLLLVES